MTATEIATGHLSINPQDRVIFGKPAAEAVPAEMARQGVSRAFVTSTASLARLSDGPLQAVLAGLGATCVGVHSIGVLLQWMDAKPQFLESPLPP